MVADRQRLVEFVAKLNRKTQEGSIEWNLRHAPEDFTAGTDDKIPLFFGAEFEKGRLGLYTRRYRDYDPDNDQQYWAESTVLAFCAQDWTPIWEFPSIAGIDELLASVQRHWIEADNFIDAFLAEDDDQ